MRIDVYKRDCFVLMANFGIVVYGAPGILASPEFRLLLPLLNHDRNSHR